MSPKIDKRVEPDGGKVLFEKLEAEDGEDLPKTEVVAPPKPPPGYVVVEYDRNSTTRLQEVSAPQSKSDAETECKFRNEKSDPLASLEYRVEKASVQR
jgi:hypothetical protein